MAKLGDAEVGRKTHVKLSWKMGNVTAGGVNEGEDDENEYFEVLFLLNC